MKPPSRKTFVDPRSKQTGRRTGINIRATKTIRRKADGFEDFNDYLSESDVDSTWDVSSVLKIPDDKENRVDSSSVLHRQPQGRGKAGPSFTDLHARLTHSTPVPTKKLVNKSHASVSSQNEISQGQRNRFAWFRNKNIGRRTGKDLRANKNIRVNANGLENFDDYLSESDFVPDDESVIGRSRLDASRALSSAQRADSVSTQGLTEEASTDNKQTSKGNDGNSHRPQEMGSDSTESKDNHIVQDSISSTGNQNRSWKGSNRQHKSLQKEDIEQASVSDHIHESSFSSARNHSKPVIEDGHHGDVEEEVVDELDGISMARGNVDTCIDQISQCKSVLNQDNNDVSNDDSVVGDEAGVIDKSNIKQLSVAEKHNQNGSMVKQIDGYIGNYDEDDDKDVKYYHATPTDTEKHQSVPIVTGDSDAEVGEDIGNESNQSTVAVVNDPIENVDDDNDDDDYDDDDDDSIDRIQTDAMVSSKSEKTQMKASVGRDLHQSRSITASDSRVNNTLNNCVKKLSKREIVMRNDRKSSKGNKSYNTNKSLTADESQRGSVRNISMKGDSLVSQTLSDTDVVDNGAEFEEHGRAVSRNCSQPSRYDNAKNCSTATGIDVAGNQSGSITRLDIPTSAISFNRTRKRLSYSAAQHSDESQRSRKMRVEEANKELKSKILDEDGQMKTSSISNYAGTSSTKATQPAVDSGRLHKTSVACIEKSKTSEYDEVICLGLRSKSTLQSSASGSEDDISIVEEPVKSTVRRDRAKQTKHSAKGKNKGTKTKRIETISINEMSDVLQSEHNTKAKKRNSKKIADNATEVDKSFNIPSSECDLTPNECSPHARNQDITNDLPSEVKDIGESAGHQKSIKSQRTSRNRRIVNKKAKNAKNEKPTNKKKVVQSQPDGNQSNISNSDSVMEDEENNFENLNVDNSDKTHPDRKSASRNTVLVDNLFQNNYGNETIYNTDQADVEGRIEPEYSIQAGKRILTTKTSSVSSQGNSADSESTPLRSDRRTDQHKKSLKLSKRRTLSSSKSSSGRQRYLKRKSSEEFADSEVTSDANMKVRKKVQNLKTSRAAKALGSDGIIDNNREVNLTRQADGNASDDMSEEYTSPVDNKQHKTPARDSNITVPTNYGSGVSFRVCRRSEVLEGVQSGYVADLPVVEVDQPTTPLVSCLTQPGLRRKKALRRVTIGDEEVHVSDARSPMMHRSTRSSRRASSLGNCTGLPSPSSTPMHVFETTCSATPSSQDLQDRLIMPPPPPPGLRRSQRTRTKPVAWHKGERLIYDYKRSGMSIVGVKPSNEIKYLKQEAEKRKRRRLMYEVRKATQGDKKSKRKLSIHANMPDLTPSTSHEVSVLNPFTQEEDGIECVSKYNSYEAVGPNHGTPTKDDPYMITKYIDQPIITAGELTLKPLAEKPENLNTSWVMLYKVEYGVLTVKIHKTTIIMETGDTFFVPIGNSYSIRNMRRDEAKLFYTVVKNIPNAEESLGNS